jgi:3-hydroxymyristoyl/3-hydroxydecanoyl-(acyl carrier protein) dehydratase
MFYLAANSMKYTHPAAPGDILVLRAEADSSFGGLHRFKVEASSGRHLVASGTLTLAFVGDPP